MILENTSCETQLVNTIETVARSLDKKEQVDIGLFQGVWHRATSASDQQDGALWNKRQHT
jgi:hypothetical protein